MNKNIGWIKAIGGGWLALGAAAIGWGMWTLFNRPDDALFISPWSELSILALGVAACVGGLGLLWKRGWAQGVTASTHALLCVYALAFLPLAYAERANRPTYALVIGLIGLSNAILALLMSSATVSEALSWLPLQTVYVQTSNCAFCGAPLDPQTETCPHCEAIPGIVREYLDSETPRASLVSDEIGVQFPIAMPGKTRIGREPAQNEINLNNPTISRNHAWIEYQNGHFVLYASDDANGTFVNEQRVRRHVLSSGDGVRLGRMRFRFVIENVQGK